MNPMVETSAIVTALQGVATNAQSVVNDVAPIGVGILGTLVISCCTAFQVSISIMASWSS